ncbi:MAG: DUF4296 domain-containing protein [Winogradskyella sp.]
MYKNISVIVAVVLMFLACDKVTKVEKPERLIGKEKMSEILYDLYVINSAKSVNRKLLEKNGFIPETYILEKYNIDSVQFKESNRYYTFDSEVYEDIIEKVKLRLEAEKSSYEKIQEQEAELKKQRKDSIQRVDSKKKMPKTVKDSTAIKK